MCYLDLGNQETKPRVGELYAKQEGLSMYIWSWHPQPPLPIQLPDYRRPGLHPPHGTLEAWIWGTRKTQKETLKDRQKRFHDKQLTTMTCITEKMKITHALRVSLSFYLNTLNHAWTINNYETSEDNPSHECWNKLYKWKKATQKKWLGW